MLRWTFTAIISTECRVITEIVKFEHLFRSAILRVASCKKCALTTSLGSQRNMRTSVGAVEEIDWCHTHKHAQGLVWSVFSFILILPARCLRFNVDSCVFAVAGRFVRCDSCASLSKPNNKSSSSENFPGRVFSPETHVPSRSSWPLFDHCLTTVWALFDHCLTTVVNKTVGHLSTGMLVDLSLQHAVMRLRDYLSES